MTEFTDANLDFAKLLTRVLRVKQEQKLTLAQTYEQAKRELMTYNLAPDAYEHALSRIATALNF